MTSVFKRVHHALRGRAVWLAVACWVFTALLVVDLGATPHAVATSTLQRFGALQREGAPGVVSHRGAAQLAPENTLAAVDAAIRAGADFVEIDLRYSRDGEAVVMHDPTVNRTTNGTGRVDRLTLEEIRALDAGAWFAPEFAGERVPTFEEAVEVLDPAPAAVLVELKDEWSEARLAPLVALLRERQMTHRVLLQSFNLDTMEALARVAPDFARMLLTRELGDEVVDRAIELGVSAIGAKAALYAAFPQAVEQIRARGLGAAVYTLNSPEEWQVALERGIDFVITDDPAAFSAWRQHASDALSAPQ